MRHQTQHVINHHSAKAFAVETMEPRTLLSSVLYEASHPSGYVPPSFHGDWHAHSDAKPTHNFRTMSLPAEATDDVEMPIEFGEVEVNIESDRPRFDRWPQMRGDLPDADFAWRPTGYEQSAFPMLPGGVLVRFIPAPASKAPHAEAKRINDPSDDSNISVATRQVLATDPAAASETQSAAVTGNGRVSTAAVSKEIFSNQPIHSEVAKTVSIGGVLATPSAATAIGNGEAYSRSVLMYLSLLTGDARPVWVEAKAATARVITESVGVSVKENASAIMAAALQSLPSPQQAVQIVRLASPLMLVADSVGAFIEESAQLPKFTGHTSRPHRAWSITAAVIAADLLLLAYCYRSRRESQTAALPDAI